MHETVLSEGKLRESEQAEKDSEGFGRDSLFFLFDSAKFRTVFDI